MTYKSNYESPNFSDYLSLKKKLEADYGTNKMKIHETEYYQTGSGSAVELEEKGGETISQIGSTELTLVCAMSADDNDYDAAEVTLVYVDNEGTSHTTVATINSVDSTTEVAFSPVISDFYAPISCTIDVACKAGHYCYVGETGLASPVVTINPTKTEAEDADMIGVGSVTISQKTNQVGSNGDVSGSLEYVTPWGEVKTAKFTTDASDTSVEVKPTISDISVKDFYRLRDFSFDMAATDELLLSSIGVDTIYGVIKATYDTAIFTRYRCPSGDYTYESWIGKIKGNISTANVVLSVTYIPYGKVAEVTMNYYLSQTQFDIDILKRIKPDSDVVFKITGNTALMNYNLKILECYT